MHVQHAPGIQGDDEREVPVHGELSRLLAPLAGEIAPDLAAQGPTRDVLVVQPAAVLGRQRAGQQRGRGIVPCARLTTTTTNVTPGPSADFEMPLQLKLSLTVWSLAAQACSKSCMA